MKKLGVGSGLAALITAHFIWGINIPVNKLALETLPPATFAFFKLILAAGLLALPAYSVWKKMDFKSVIRVVIGGSMTLVAEILFLYAGLKQSSGISAALIYAFGPILLFVISIVFLHEPFKKRVAIGLPIAFLGAMLVIFEPVISGAGGGVATSFVGNLFFLISMMCSVIGILIYKPVLVKYHPLQVTFLTIAVASIIMSLFAGLEADRWAIKDVAQEAWIAVLYGGFIVLSVAFYLYFEGLRRTATIDLSLVKYLTTIGAIIGSILLLGESLNLITVVGGLLILFGIVVGETKKSPWMRYFAHNARH